MSSKTNQKKRYTKMDPIEHVLKRSDMYVGSKDIEQIDEYVGKKDDNDVFSIFKDKILSSPALLRIFVEPLSNAVDNVLESKNTKTPCTKIQISIDKKTGETTLWNDGDIVPIEIDEEHKMYNHTLIFGNLLTGSNYDDDVERFKSGKNGLGVKCQGKGTLLPTWCGQIKKIEDIKVGEFLIGDDGSPRKVLKTIEGFGNLYEVSQSRGNAYIVNSEHILSVRMPDHKVIFWNQSKQGWSMLWLDKEQQKIITKCVYLNINTPFSCPECGVKLSSNLSRHYKRVHKGITVPKFKRNSPTDEKIIKAKEEMENFRDTITDDNIWDINIQDYLKLSDSIKGKLTGFFGDCVQWKHDKVELDPYVLGLLLSDSFKNDRGFTINSREDPEILEYLEKWGKCNDVELVQYSPETNPVQYVIRPASKCSVALKRLLKTYKLDDNDNDNDNKNIPREYLINSKEVRLSVLAGLIDSDGTVQSDGIITITQGMNNFKLVQDIIFLAHSLGFMCSNYINKTQWNHKGELIRGKSVNINISGKGVDDIPTLVKKCLNPLKREVLNSGKLKIKKVKDGEFVGITVDNNERFVLEDFTVTHNCSNIYSHKFIVEGVDPTVGKKFVQEWRNNMRDTDGPVVTDTSLKRGYTKVTYFPDFAQFKMNGYTNDVINLYTRYVIDAAMLTRVSVYLNGVLVPVKSLSDYSKLYKNPTDEKLLIKTKNCEVFVTPSNEFQAISFVNGVYTRLGGTHVDAWSEAIFRPIIDKFNGVKNKKVTKTLITIKDVKQFFRIFVVASVDKPVFNGQEKEKLKKPDVVASFKKTDLNKICKWSVYDKIEQIIRDKDFLMLKKSERKKKGYVKVDGLDPANNAGTKYSSECTLILCEGDSAKTYAVAGIEEGYDGKSGRDWFGVLALRGKVFNVRDAPVKRIADNKEVTSIINALGARYDLDYTIDANYNTLLYGNVMLLSDADVDGTHINSLIMNMMHCLFPTLLERPKPFLISMKTPIVRVFRPRGKDLLFYNEDKYKEYALKNSKNKIDKKYYKGLGTTKPEDIPDTFGMKMVEYINDENTTFNMLKLFTKKQADARKKWLSEYDPKKTISLDDKPVTEMNISDFINYEVIKFSLADCARSIPNGIDGLKQCQRKILYCVKKKNLKYGGKSLKVAQLGGYVAEHSNYQHGEHNLYGTITGMAQNYPGSNNIPLLYRDGMFGSRAFGGKDAASPRYIYTKMDMMTQLIFRPEDDILLKQIVDDGDVVEPVFYIPIIPMILVNGVTCGIGTGWSSNVPSYNPLDLIECIKIWLKEDGNVLIENGDTFLSKFPELVPWYRGFEGVIEPLGDKFISYGVCEDVKDNTVVTELPIGLWTDKFKEILEDHVQSKQIISMKNYSTPSKVNFVLKESKDGFKLNVKNLGMSKYIHVTNMVMFNEKGQLKKYDTVDSIINNFCGIRYMYYIKRKKHCINSLENELKFLGNKERFIREVIDKIIDIMNVPEQEIINSLEKDGYDKKITEGEEDEGGYNYLLRMQVRTFTKEKVKKINNEILSKQKEIDNLRKVSEKQLWLNDLSDFEKEYPKFLKEMKVVKKTKKK
jgi:DNA topoisomerase-2